jgi:hypothetical protein
MKYIGDISTLTFEKVDDIAYGFQLPIQIGFRDNGSLPVTFQDLRFEYQLKQGTEIISSYVMDDIYISTDQDYIYSTMIDNLTPNGEYTIVVMADHSGKEFKSVIENIVLPLPPSPYPSWLWDAEKNEWVIPLPMPTDPPPDKWVWDEETVQWVERAPAFVE